MPKTTGHVATEHGSKYLQQLCKHFAHKIPVEYDATSGYAEFPLGTAKMTADASGLSIEFTLTGADRVATAHHVIDSHLKTFAHREKIEGMIWDS